MEVRGYRKTRTVPANVFCRLMMSVTDHVEMLDLPHYTDLFYKAHFPVTAEKLLEML